MDGAPAIPLTTRLAEEPQFTLALDDPVVAGSRTETRPDPRLSRQVAEDVIDLIATALSGETRQDLPEFLSSTFLQEVARMAADEGVELSEADCVQLLTEAASVELAVFTAEHVRGSLESCLGRASAPNNTFYSALNHRLRTLPGT